MTWNPGNWPAYPHVRSEDAYEGMTKRELKEETGMTAPDLITRLREMAADASGDLADFDLQIPAVLARQASADAAAVLLRAADEIERLQAELNCMPEAARELFGSSAAAMWSAYCDAKMELEALRWRRIDENTPSDRHILITHVDGGKPTWVMVVPGWKEEDGWSATHWMEMPPIHTQSDSRG